jgi:hypothetical protein
MNVQCPNCGHVQEFDPGYKICLNCGGAMDESNSRILKNPRRGRGMQGIAIIAFLFFFFIFLFWSKYAGSHGMAISALVYIWGIYKTYLNKKSISQNHAH